jgi:hypothetical protein
MLVVMPRTDIYLKVTVDHRSDDQPEKLAAEIIRQVQKVYGVRRAELSNFVTHATVDEES